MTQSEAQAVRDRIAQALPGHRVEIILQEVEGPHGPCHPSTITPAIRIDNYLLSHRDPISSVRAIFGVEV